MDTNSQYIITILIALVCSVIPAFIWLFFWTREDKKNPEPKSMIALAFIGGAIAVSISLFLEKYFYGLGLSNLISSNIFSSMLSWFTTLASQTNVPVDKILLVTIFAPFIEETSKFVMAYVLVLRAKCDDEPLDPMIYMITTALGFAAIENMLFLITSWDQSHSIISGIFTANMRFVGAMLLHTISSAIIALFMSFHFFDSKIKKILFTMVGIACAIIMHGIFNILMIGNQSWSTFALELIWIIVIILLLAFEKIKQIKRERVI